jgi:hypothetical protein
MKKFNTKNSESGQTLIALLIFMIVAISVMTTSVILISANSIAASKVEQSISAYNTAESGAENALLRLLRDPFYTGETITVDSGTAVTTVSGTTTKTITSTGTSGNFIRKIQVVVDYNNNIMTVTSWKEIF